MVRCQRPDKRPKGSYAGAPNKNHSGRSVAKLPNGHKSDDIDHSNHAEPETSNDQQKFLATQEFLLPKAQLLSTIFAPYRVSPNNYTLRNTANWLLTSSF